MVDIRRPVNPHQLHPSSYLITEKSKQSCRPVFGCFYTGSHGLTDVCALSVWLHAKWHNVDSTWSCVPLVCLGVFFTVVDYAHFPCCSSLWCYLPDSTQYEATVDTFYRWTEISPGIISPLSLVHCTGDHWWRCPVFSWQQRTNVVNGPSGLLHWPQVQLAMIELRKEEVWWLFYSGSRSQWLQQEITSSSMEVKFSAVMRWGIWLTWLVLFGFRLSSTEVAISSFVKSKQWHDL